MGIKIFLKDGFGGKTNVVSVWEKHILVICQFLGDEVETIFGKVR